MWSQVQTEFLRQTLSTSLASSSSLEVFWKCFILIKWKSITSVSCQMIHGAHGGLVSIAKHYNNYYFLPSLSTVLSSEEIPPRWYKNQIMRSRLTREEETRGFWCISGCCKGCIHTLLTKRVKEMLPMNMTESTECRINLLTTVLWSPGQP